MKIRLLNKGKIKNLSKRDNILKTSNLKSKKGSAIAETIILIAVSLVIAVIIFYPQFTELLNNIMGRMNGWINSTLMIIYEEYEL